MGGVAGAGAWSKPAVLGALAAAGVRGWDASRVGPEAKGVSGLKYWKQAMLDAAAAWWVLHRRA